MKKITVTGEKGKTICYELSNFRYENQCVCWDTFRFYSPLGVQVNADGNKYFDVPGISEIIERDDTLNKEVLFKVTQSDGIEVIEILEGASPPYMSVGLDGDIVCVLFVPADPQESIQIEYKEVIG